LNQFPTSFQEDLKAYLNRHTAHSVLDLLDETLSVKPWRQATIKTTTDQIRQAASILVRTGMDIGSVDSLAVLTDLVNFKSILKFLLDRRHEGSENTKTAGQMASALLAIAKHHVKRPVSEITKLSVICTSLNRNPRSMTEKNADLLVQFEDPEVESRFLAFPESQIKVLKAMNRMSRLDAVQYSLLVALAVLISAPMRVKNLAALNLETNLRLPVEPNGQVVIVLPGSSVKNGKAMRFKLPARLTPVLREYIEKVKPLLERDPSPWLFPGGKGGSKRENTLSKQITALVGRYVNVKYFPNLQRHMTVKIFSEEGSGSIEAASRMLGHQSLDTTNTFYGGMLSSKIGQRYDDILQSRMTPVAPPAIPTAALVPRVKRRRVTKRDA